MAVKLPRTVRLDPSDTFVFSETAAPGEWAVSGAFRFWDVDVASLPSKERHAFRSGFLGTDSFGWSTLVVVTEASAEERAQAIEALAKQLVARLGAPDLETARAAAAEEVAFAESLCEHPVGTLLGVYRSLDEDGVREQFRTLHRRADRLQPARVFSWVEDGAPEEPAEEVDLAKLARPERP